MQKNYLFSVIIPCYNTEQYIEECIDSVIAQSIGFLETTQVIIIDDGSDDRTFEMCQGYKRQYPNNFVCLTQNHEGASSARNLGLSQAEGEYVCFLDSDDKWDARAFEEIHKFFSENPTINIVASRIHYFDAWDTPHALDRKFKESRVINIFASPNNPQLSGTTCCYRKRVLCDEVFPKVEVSEDFRFVSKLILENGAFGVLRESVYYYRKRPDSSSTIDNSRKNLTFYFDTVESVYCYLMDLSRSLYGFVIPYIQYSIMYDLQWRLIAKNEGFLNDEQTEAYKRAFESLLANMSDKVICNQPRLTTGQKVYALALKKQEPYEDVLSTLALKWLPSKKKLALLTQEGAVVCYPLVLLEFVDICKGKLHIEGRLHGPFSPSGVTIEARKKDAKYRASLFGRKDREESVFFEAGFYRRIGFVLDLDVDEHSMITFHIGFNGASGKLAIRFGPLCKLSGGNVNSYCRQQGHYIVARRNNRLEIKQDSSMLYFAKRELSFCRNIIQKHGREVLPTVILRWQTLFLRAVMPNKRIWLLSDRIQEAGDNGEAMFSFVADRKDVKAYYAISKDSKDFKRIAAIGRVVAYGSKRYQRLFLRSSHILSSSFDPHVYRLACANEQYLKSLYGFRYVFLQHGVTQHDLSGTLGRYKKNIALFVTSSKREMDNILDNEYYYDEGHLALTGMPRFDFLNREVQPKRIVTYAPTWRNDLVASFSQDDDSALIHEELFVSSEYYQRIESFISNEQLARALKDFGYTLELVLHPGFRKLAYLFSSSEIVRIPMEYEYQKGFLDSALLITDYSSVAFDFAFLKKPLAYYQFDEEKVVGGGHIFAKGYFDYREDGFGPVIEDEASLVDFVIEQISETPTMEKQYADRVDAFFFHPNEGTSHRQLLFDRIIETETDDNIMR